MLRVLTWNVRHGRAVASPGGDPLDALGDALERWAWDVALLQAVAHAWPERLAARLGAEQRTALAARRSGGASTILAASDRIVDEATLRLGRWPRPRRVHGVRLACGAWVANLHASERGGAAAAHDVADAVRAARGWSRASRAPLIVGGALGLRELTADGLRQVAGRDVDHVLVSEGVIAVGEAEPGSRLMESDHSPLAVTLELDPR